MFRPYHRLNNCRRLERWFDSYLDTGNITEDVIKAWINYKIENEVKVIAAKPHPQEFALYYNV